MRGSIVVLLVLLCGVAPLPGQEAASPAKACSALVAFDVQLFRRATMIDSGTSGPTVCGRRAVFITPTWRSSWSHLNCLSRTC